MFGITGEIRAVIVGARDGIGAQFVQLLGAHPGCRVVATSRDPDWAAAPSGAPGVERFRVDLCAEDSVNALGEHLSQTAFAPNLILNCTGLLHADAVQPERTWRALKQAEMTAVFAVNTIGVGLLIRALMPLIPRRDRAVFASLSARVGSIGDNRLGGWYSYRASKAAQNMLLRCAALEAKRLWPDLVVLALHPGTVDTALSKPFSKRVPAHKLFSVETSCAHLESVIRARTPKDSGGFFAWDGQPIIW